MKGAAVQGETPPTFIPQHSESELVEAMKGTDHEATAADRGVLLTALTELESRGWMKLHKVMGPWSWQVTPAGVDKASDLAEQQRKMEREREKEIRQGILDALEDRRRAVAGLSRIPAPLDVSALCDQWHVDTQTFVIQCERLLDQGLVEFFPFDQATIANGEIVITETGRQRLDAAPPGAAPTREAADLYRENAHLRRELETVHSSVDSLVRDAQLRDRVIPLIAREKNYDTAVREACVILEDRVRTRAQASAALVSCPGGS